MNDIDDTDGKYGHGMPTLNKVWVAAGVAMVVVVALLIWRMVSDQGSDQQSHRPSSSPPSSPSRGAVLASGPHAVQSEGIAFGHGATTKAADGVTPIGWPSTCAGAVNSAATTLVALTNAEPGVDLGTAKARPAPARSGLRETVDYLLQGDPQKELHSEKAWPTADYGVNKDITSGGYRVVDCTPGKTATVALFNCSTFVGSNPAEPEYAGKSVCGTDTYRLVWGGSPADWRVTEDPATRVPGPEDSGPAIAAPLTPDQRRAVLSRLEGWKEWANAPR